MKRFLFWVGIGLGTPIVLLLLLAFLLYLPPVQDFVVHEATSYASSKTGLDIRIGRLRLSFPLDVDVSELTILDAEGDTILSAGGALVDLDLSQLLHARLGIDGVTLSHVTADTRELIASTRIAGRFDELALSDDVDLSRRHVALSSVVLDGANVAIVLRDTVTVEDTTHTAIPWTLAIARAAVNRSHVSITAEADSLTIDANVPSLVAEGADINLANNIYNVRACEGEVALSRPLPLHLNLAADSIAVDADAGHLDLAHLGISTPGSRLNGAVAMDFNAFTPGARGQFKTNIHADFDREDVALALTTLDSIALAALADNWPATPLHVELQAAGNVDSVSVNHFSALLLGAVEVQAKAYATSVLDSHDRNAHIAFDVHTAELAWLLRSFGQDPRSLSLPPIAIAGTAGATGRLYELAADMSLSPSAARQLSLRAKADMSNPLLTYEAEADIRRLNVRHFLPRDSIGLVTAKATLSGTGTDILARTTRLDAHADVAQLQYGPRFDLTGLALDAHARNGKGTATLTSDNDVLSMRADVAAMLERPLSDVTFGIDLTAADLYALGVTSHPLSVAACLQLDGTTNLRDRHTLDGNVSDIVLLTADTLFRPEDLTLRATLRPDTVHAYVGSGDLVLTVDTRYGYERLLQQLDDCGKELRRQWAEKRFSIDALRVRLPLAEVHILSGSNNPAHDILLANGIGYEMANIDLMLSPSEGINAGGQVYDMLAGGVKLDSITFFAFQDTTGIELEARVKNGRRNPQFRFDSRLNAQFTDTGSVARLKYFDERGRLGVDLGLKAAIADETLRMSIDPHDPVIAYRTFRVNADNLLALHKRNRVEADIRLVADDGTGLNLYSTPNDEALQDLTLGVNRLNLGELMSVVPYAPRLTGLLAGDIHLMQHDDNLSISADMTANDLTYEQARLGQVGVQAVYMPNADGSHFVDGSLLHTGMPVATFGGTLGKADAAGVMALDVDMGLERFPLSLANGFITPTESSATPIAALEGFLNGDMHVGGTTRRPLVDGSIATSDVRVRSDAYSLSLRVVDDTIRVDETCVNLDSIKVYATGSAPLIVNGTIDASALDNIRLNMDVAARNFELMNAKRSAAAVAYGRVYVDLSAMLRGTLDNLRLIGSLNVLSATDVTYVLTDSPLSADDQLAGLVEFVDFSDTVRIEAPVEAARPQHLNIFMNISVEDAAQVHCLFSHDGANYVDLEGGGDLTLTYSPDQDMLLNGRYTVNSGSLKYTMMVIPLKEFDIKSGSYVEFRGPLTNPYLSLSATERLTTTLTENGQPRSVAFDVGLAISQTLENMGLEFTLDAPEDMTVQNELASMSAEQRGRVAVTMLATGMYITDSGGLTGGGVSTQNALNAFLQSQISNIAGRALKSVDLSMGVEQGTSAAGTTTTDYSFRFAKRFWGNRISVVVGGRVSTGEDATNTGESLIDNVSLEYRLDKSATRYVNVFYNKNHESLLDGEVIEMGAGLVLRRKTNRLGELFLFRRKE